MKLIQKSLLFATLLSAGASTTTIIPAVSNVAIVQAAKCSSSSKITVKVAKAQLYNEKGKKLSRCLTKGTTCKPKEKISIKGHKYYKVGKGEFVKASQVTVKK